MHHRSAREAIGGFTCALVIPVPALEPIVARWRDGPDHPTSGRMPAHLTVMYPFLDSLEVTAEVRSQLADLCGRTRKFDVAFTWIETFPGVVYLAPSPADEVRVLTERVTEIWPQLRPYAGRHGDIVPHLTLVHRDDDALVRQIADELEPLLPISARLTEVSLFLLTGKGWRQTFSLPFGS